MKLVVTATLLVLLPVAANAITIGKRSCADAEVLASIRNQTWNRIYDVDIKGIPKSTSSDGYLKISLDIESVVYGPITPGRIAVTMMARSALNPTYKRLHMFLEQTPAGDWWVATCDYKF